MQINYFSTDDSHIFLRDISLNDVNQNYYNWINDPEVNQYLESRFREQTIDSIKEFVQRAIDDEGTRLFAVCMKDDERHVGNVKIGGINTAHGYAEAAIMIGDKSVWGKGVGSEAIRLVTKIAFEKLALRKLMAECYANNLGSFHAFKKAGYELEGTKRSHYKCGDEYVDSYLLGIIKK